MSIIDDLRYMHNQAKSLTNSDTHPWFVKHIDALFAHIDALTSELAALKENAPAIHLPIETHEARVRFASAPSGVTAAKLPRLAPTHLDSLTRLAKGEIARRNWQRPTYYKWPGIQQLVRMGYALELIDGQWYRTTITDKGHAYLAVLAAQGEGRAK